MYRKSIPNHKKIHTANIFDLWLRTHNIYIHDIFVFALSLNTGSREYTRSAHTHTVSEKYELTHAKYETIISTFSLCILRKLLRHFYTYKQKLTRVHTHIEKYN